jgi:hypothetical protein
MTFSLTWLPATLRSVGLKVAEIDGWENRGRAEFGPLRGALCHHTAGPRTGNMPSLRTLIDGRPDLPGPLAQLGLGRDGTFYVVAAARCNHAGAGRWGNVTTGNSNFIGVEAENTGAPDDLPWPDIQMDAYRRGVAAILAHAGLSADACAGHKEYALPAGRKNDPDFDMAVFRKGVAGILSGAAAPPALIPKQEEGGLSTDHFAQLKPHKSIHQRGANLSIRELLSKTHEYSSVLLLCPKPLPQLPVFSHYPSAILSIGKTSAQAKAGYIVAAGRLAHVERALHRPWGRKYLAETARQSQRITRWTDFR